MAARSGVASTLPSSLSDLWTRHSLQAVAGRLRVSDGFPKISAQADVKLAPTPSIMDNKHKAMQGWLTDSPPPPPRDHPPGEDHKWHLMMGVAKHCPRCREVVARLRQDKIPTKSPPPD